MKIKPPESSASHRVVKRLRALQPVDSEYRQTKSMQGPTMRGKIKLPNEPILGFAVVSLYQWFTKKSGSAVSKNEPILQAPSSVSTFGSGAACLRPPN